MPAAAQALTVAELSAELGRMLADVPQSRAGPVLREVGRVALADVRAHFAQARGPDGTPWPPLAHPRPDGTTKPLTHKGLLAASVSARATREGVELTSDHPGAALLNFGGEVRPERARHLAIPLTRRAAAAGSPRGMPGLVFLARAGARSRGVLAEKLPGGRLVAHFALTDRVVVPAREFLGLSPRAAREIEWLLLDLVTAPVRGGRD